MYVHEQIIRRMMFHLLREFVEARVEKGDGKALKLTQPLARQLARNAFLILLITENPDSHRHARPKSP